MNTRRIVVLLLAAVAAGGAALLVRGIIGGGTQKADAHVSPPAIALGSVLVAANDLEPGQTLDAGKVRWQQWPKSNIAPSFITGGAGVAADAIVAGAVARAPIVTGEPITFAKIVKSDAAGFMAATLTPGMRAVSIAVTLASVAGGFILPNNRVDIVLTQSANDASKQAGSSIVLTNVRVLAIDQSSDAKNQKSVSDARTATLELTPAQVQILTRAGASGTLSLALRPLGGDGTTQEARAGANPASGDDADASGVVIIRGVPGGGRN